MEQVDNRWLSQLAEGHQPDLIGWWPLAVGWWLLMGLLIVIAVGLIYYFNRPKTKIKAAAKKALKACEALSDDHAFAVQLENLLRRYALTAFGREKMANLQGEDWLNFIVANGGTELGGESGKQFLRMVYGGQANANRQEWLKAAEHFIKGS